MAAEAHGRTLAYNVGAFVRFCSRYTHVYACSMHSFFHMRIPGKSLNSVLYDAWASCGEGNWTESKFLLRIRERHTCRRRGVRRWLTKAEIDERFGADLGLQIRNRKLFDEELRKKEVRENPNLPGVEDRPLDCLLIFLLIYAVFGESWKFVSHTCMTEFTEQYVHRHACQSAPPGDEPIFDSCRRFRRRRK